MKRMKRKKIEETIEKAKQTITYKDLTLATAEIQQELQINPPLKAYKNLNDIKNQIHLIANEGLLSPKDKPLFSTLTNWILQTLKVKGWEVGEKYEKPLYMPPFYVSVRKCQDFLESEGLKYSGGYRRNGYLYPCRALFNIPYVDDTARVVDVILKETSLKDKDICIRADKAIANSRVYEDALKVFKYIQLWVQMNDYDIREGLSAENGRAGKKR